MTSSFWLSSLIQIFVQGVPLSRQNITSKVDSGRYYIFCLTHRTTYPTASLFGSSYPRSTAIQLPPDDQNIGHGLSVTNDCRKYIGIDPARADGRGISSAAWFRASVIYSQRGPVEDDVKRRTCRQGLDEEKASSVRGRNILFSFLAN
jgi:hypothetical protein